MGLWYEVVEWRRLLVCCMVSENIKLLYVIPWFIQNRVIHNETCWYDTILQMPLHFSSLVWNLINEKRIVMLSSWRTLLFKQCTVACSTQRKQRCHFHSSSQFNWYDGNPKVRSFIYLCLSYSRLRKVSKRSNRRYGSDHANDFENDHFCIFRISVAIPFVMTLSWNNWPIHFSRLPTKLY